MPYSIVFFFCGFLAACDVPRTPEHRERSVEAPTQGLEAEPVSAAEPKLTEPEIEPEEEQKEEDPPMTLIRIGEPQHRYPLLKELPVSDPPEMPHFTTHPRVDGTLEVRFPLTEDEAIWGFGQRFDAFNMRGRRIESWATDSWNNPDTSYFAVPFFISSRGFGLFVNCTGRVTFDIGAKKQGVLSIVIPEPGVDLILMHGEPADVSRAYTSLVGRPPYAPEWIYRAWLSRNSYLGAYEINRVLRRMRDLDMPVGVIVLEAWSEELHNFQFERRRYPNPITWIRRLQQRDVHVVCWITSSVWPGSKAHQEAREKGFLVLNEDGSEHIVRWLENGRKIDFRIPEAREWWRDMQKPLVDTGISGIKTDGGEHMPDAFFHNQHPYYYQKASLDAFREQDRKGIIFSRSGNPLTAGLGLVWAGDQDAEWSGLAAVVRAGLSAAFSGYPLWGHDIGAYSGIPAKDLYIRWLQFGAFSPIMQFHGESPREPWRFDEETLEIARFYFGVRERILPLLQEWGNQALADGTPIIRPLPWHYPDDPAVRDIDDQYLLGPHLLIAPVTRPGHSRPVYLPEGDWIDVWDGTAYTGPTRLDYHSELYQIPVFVRADAYARYSGLFDDAPHGKTPPIGIEQIEPRNAWGVAQKLLYARGNDPIEIAYRVSNHTDEATAIGIRMAPQAGIQAHPSQIIRFLLEPGASRDIRYAARAGDGTTPGTYPLTLEARRGGRDIDAPTAALVVSPEWKALGPFDGGVASEQPLDNQPVDYEATYEGPNGERISWRDVPSSAMQDDGAIDVGTVIGGGGFSTSYMHTTIFSQWPRRVRFLVGSGDAMTLWVNGREVLHLPVHRNPERDEDRVDTVLTGGLNQILIRISRDLAPHRFYFRVE